MEVLDAITKRRSIRVFEDTPLDKSMVEDVINCGRLAPSAKNRQPWYFVVVQKDIKNKIADVMIEDFAKRNNEEEQAKLGCPNSVKPTANVIKQAPILILVFKEKNDLWIEGDNLSIGACVENMCLRATDLGLGSLWIRDIIYVAKDVAKLLNHEDMELNCALSIGYTSQLPSARPRKELNDIIEWYNL